MFFFVHKSLLSHVAYRHCLHHPGNRTKKCFKSCSRKNLFGADSMNLEWVAFFSR